MPDLEAEDPLPLSDLEAEDPLPLPEPEEEDPEEEDPLPPLTPFPEPELEPGL